MRSYLLPLALTLALPAAHAQTGTPAPLNGIWNLTGLTERAADGQRTAPVGAQLFISGDRIWGTYGCARFEGRVQAGRNEVRFTGAQVTSQVRCLIAVRGDFLKDLNDARRYVVNRDHLIVFSRAGRLAFERVGFVTPAKGR